jgi:hypothetical protein
MHRPSRLRVAVLVALALVACSSQQRSGKSPEEQLVETRQELRDTIDRLFTTYGGSEITGRSSGGSPGTTGGVLGHVVGEADRSLFERQCLATGRGERPVAVSPKLREFLDRAEVASECRRASDLQRRVTELEREVAGRR